jgi:hypothetical protein
VTYSRTACRCVRARDGFAGSGRSVFPMASEQRSTNPKSRSNEVVPEKFVRFSWSTLAMAPGRRKAYRPVLTKPISVLKARRGPLGHSFRCPGNRRARTHRHACVRFASKAVFPGFGSCCDNTALQRNFQLRIKDLGDSIGCRVAAGRARDGRRQSCACAPGDGA